MFKTDIVISLQIPLALKEISNDNHPVEVGLADAFYIDIRLGFCKIY